MIFGFMTSDSRKSLSPVSGSVASRPVMKVFGNDSVNISVNSKVIHLNNVVDYVTID